MLSPLRAPRRRKAQEHPVVAPRRALDEATKNEIRNQFRDCAQRLGGEVSARIRAARLGETYLALDETGRHEFLRILALEFGPEPKEVEIAHSVYQTMVGTHMQWDAEAALRTVMRSKRVRILTQFNALPQGVKFLVDMREDLLRFVGDDPGLAALDREMEARLSAWFDVGFLELHRITWDSPAALLEKLIQYEAVHAISSWNDLRHRLDSDRRCYAFFHPRMPKEPLIFVEVALTQELSGSVQRLLDENRRVSDPDRASAAIFYSISNTQPGLRGVHFGNFLLKRVIDDLRGEFPRLKIFSTLSPIPQLSKWVEENPVQLEAALGPSLLHKLSAAMGAAKVPIAEYLTSGQWAANENLRKILRAPLTRMATRYLTQAKEQGRPFDPVARFHLGNGARVERLNWLGDVSARGMRQSFGFMVNYLYERDDIERNVEVFAHAGVVNASSQVTRVLNGAK
ncbi:MAG: malonyl-CoA decarboxylase [Burkholderiales bacterium]